MLKEGSRLVFSGSQLLLRAIEAEGDDLQVAIVGDRDLDGLIDGEHLGGVCRLLSRSSDAEDGQQQDGGDDRC